MSYQKNKNTVTYYGVVKHTCSQELKETHSCRTNPNSLPLARLRPESQGLVVEILKWDTTRYLMNQR